MIQKTRKKRARHGRGGYNPLISRRSGYATVFNDNYRYYNRCT